jgi:hypothetical protein
VTVYDLRDNRRYVESVQHATVNRPGYGLDPHPALFGTKEWWEAVDDGRIPSRVELGVVADVWWGSMGDWPEWRFRSAEGQETTWTREGDHTRYVTGLRARIRVATVRWKPDSPVLRQIRQHPEHDILIKVELEASDQRAERLGPVPLRAPMTFLRLPRRNDPRHRDAYRQRTQLGRTARPGS